MHLNDFRKVPLMRRYFSLDKDTGDLYMHEVRRDPDTGLTLKAKFTPAQLEAIQHKDHHHG